MGLPDPQQQRLLEEKEHETEGQQIRDRSQSQERIPKLRFPRDDPWIRLGAGQNAILFSE